MPKPTRATKALGQAIHAARTDRDLTRELVAERTGHDLSTIQRAEYGTTDIKVSTLLLIAAALEVKPEDLLAEVSVEMIPPRAPRSRNRQKIRAARQRGGV